MTHTARTGRCRDVTGAQPFQIIAAASAIPNASPWWPPMFSARKAAENSRAMMRPAGMRCHHGPAVRALACQDAAPSAAAATRVTPIRLCVPLRWPPLMWCTIQAKAPVRKPNVRAMVDPGSSMSGSTPAPAVRATAAARCTPVTCSRGAAAVKARAPDSAWSRPSMAGSSWGRVRGVLPRYAAAPAFTGSRAGAYRFLGLAALGGSAPT